MEYLFADDTLYSHGMMHQTVEPDTLVCYDVRYDKGGLRAGSEFWTFKIKGRGDTVYFTTYDWALVVHTPENVLVLQKYRTADMLAAEAVQERNKLFAQLVKAPKE